MLQLIYLDLDPTINKKNRIRIRPSRKKYSDTDLGLFYLNI